MTTTAKPPLDFTKVEALRKHMLLTVQDMAKLLGVTRMTYYGWIEGKTPRRKNDEKVRHVLKQLLGLMTEHDWPTPDVISATQEQRVAKLYKLLERQAQGE